MQCSKCNGSGEITDMRDRTITCTRCNGTGEITPRLKIECPRCEGTGKIDPPILVIDQDRIIKEREPGQPDDSLSIDKVWIEPKEFSESIKCPRCHGTGQLNSQMGDGDEPYDGDRDMPIRKRKEL